MKRLPLQRKSRQNWKSRQRERVARVETLSFFDLTAAVEAAACGCAICKQHAESHEKIATAEKESTKLEESTERESRKSRNSFIL